MKHEKTIQFVFFVLILQGMLHSFFHRDERIRIEKLESCQPVAISHEKEIESLKADIHDLKCRLIRAGVELGDLRKPLFRNNP